MLSWQTQHVVSSLIMNSGSQDLLSEFQAEFNRTVTPQTPQLLQRPATSRPRQHPTRGSPPTQTLTNHETTPFASLPDTPDFSSRYGASEHSPQDRSNPPVPRIKAAESQKHRIPISPPTPPQPGGHYLAAARPAPHVTALREGSARPRTAGRGGGEGRRPPPAPAPR